MTSPKLKVSQRSSKWASHTRRRVRKKNQEQLFDKYELYHEAVQSPENDVEFFRQVYRELKNKNPKTLREDFCGTFALSCAWAQLNPKHIAIGVDYDPEPLEYGRRKFQMRRMTDKQSKRIDLLEMNVLTGHLPPADIAVAMNFSYFIFLTRESLKKYFANVYKSTRPGGLFIMDTFGGQMCYSANEENTKHPKFTYYWDQQSFDPVSNRAMFYIHFKVKGQKKRQRVFRYDWRMWSIPELRDILDEVGFKRTHVYWEGTTRSGEGDGVFTRTEKGEACDSWIAYVVAEK